MSIPGTRAQSQSICIYLINKSFRTIFFLFIAFSEELQKIADLCQEFNVICVSDEVYEWMVYGEEEHIRICTLPGMWDRTITIGSAGKTLAVTGWRLGWAYGSAALIRNMNFVHANAVYACPTPLQVSSINSISSRMS